MNTENLFIIAGTTIILTFMCLVLYSTHQEHKLDQERYITCINAGHSWIPVENGMCLTKDILK